MSSSFSMYRWYNLNWVLCSTFPCMLDVLKSNIAFWWISYQCFLLLDFPKSCSLNYLDGLWWWSIPIFTLLILTILTWLSFVQVTIEDHPHLPGKHASIHPCRHGAVMKKIIDVLMSHGVEPEVDKYCFSLWVPVTLTCATHYYVASGSGQFSLYLRDSFCQVLCSLDLVTLS